MSNFVRGCFFVLGAACVAVPASAQTTISSGDSITRAVAAQSSENLLVSLHDADYVKLDVTHPSGFTVNVLKPDGSTLRAFITTDLDGRHPIAFVAEGAGQYAIAVTNTKSAPAKYTIVFRENEPVDARTRSMPSHDDEVRSPRIESLRRQLDSGRTTSAQLWDAIKKEGSPIVEPIDPLYDLVTFLWRQQGETRNVYVIATVSRPGEPTDTMTRLGKSDIWYLTMKLPKGARFRYQLEPNRPSRDGIIRVTRQMDPLNRGAKFNCPADASKFRCWSVTELPEAVPQQWIAKRAGVPEGRITHDSIHSALQKVNRPLIIYTPPGYSSRGKPYSLVVFPGVVSSISLRIAPSEISWRRS